MRISFADRNESGAKVERTLNLNVVTGDIETRVRGLNNNANFSKYFEAFVVDGDTIDIRFKNKSWNNDDKNVRVAWFDGVPGKPVNLKATEGVLANNFDSNSIVAHLKGQVDTNGDGLINGNDGLKALSDDGAKNLQADRFDVKFVAGRLTLTGVEAGENFSNLRLDGTSVRSVVTSYVKPEESKNGSQISVNGVRINMVGVRDLASLVTRINDAGITGIKAEADVETGRLSLVSGTGQNITIRSWTGETSKVGNQFFKGVAQAATESLSLIHI